MRLLLLALVPLAACSNAPRQDCACLASIGDLESPAALDFGNVPLGSSVTRMVELINVGTAPVDITGSGIQGDAGVGFSVSDAGLLALPAGGRTEWQITFTPSDIGPAIGWLVLANDGEDDQAAVEMTGVGAAPSCGCAPAALTFGPIAVDTPASAQVVTCTNPSATSCLVSIDTDATNPAFQVTDANGLVSAANAQTLAPDSGYAFSVSFEPPTAGTFDSSVSYTVCAEANVCAPPQTIALAGTATPICAFTITPSPIAFSAATQTQAVTVTNTAPNAVYLPCISLDSLGATACGESSAAYAFSGLPAFPSSLGPDAGLTFTLTATGAHGDDLLDVSCLPQGASVPTLFTAPITEGM